MRSGYKKLGDFIKPVKVKNKELKYSKLLGINIDKYFMPSVANVVGTNMARYKIICPGQFACNRMHVGRDYRIPIALSREVDPFIISPAYDVFEITKPNELDAEYLMMWFSRKEFDRNAWYYTDADVRGGLPWDAFCNLELPVPSIAKQREVVAEYNSVVNRIKLNEQISQKLEETAQAIYRRWFVEVAAMESLPYGWRLGKLTDLIEVKYGKAYSHLEEGEIPLYGSGGVMGKVNKALYTKPSVLIPRKGSLSNIMLVNHPFWSVDTMFYSKFNNEMDGYYAYYVLKQLNFKALNQGSAVPSMTTAFLKDIDVVLPTKGTLKDFYDITKRIIVYKEYLEKENQNLGEIKALVLSKMTKIKIEKELQWN
jgi:type I restriction enzyme S subunit